jgi:hypothetical protein
MLVERLERSAVDVPLQLLSDQAHADELDDRRLQFASGLTPVVFAERGR